MNDQVVLNEPVNLLFVGGCADGEWRIPADGPFTYCLDMRNFKMSNPAHFFTDPIPNLREEIKQASEPIRQRYHRKLLTDAKNGGIFPVMVHEELSLDDLLRLLLENYRPKEAHNG